MRANDGDHAQCTPTVVGVSDLDFNPFMDAQDLHTVREILSSRNCSQRQRIQHTYSMSYCQEITGLIDKEVASGAYQTLLKCCFFCDEQLLAVFLDKAFEHRGVDPLFTVKFDNNELETTRPLVLSTESQTIKKNFQDFYASRYKKSVLDAIDDLDATDFLNVCREMQTRVRLGDEMTDALLPPLEYAKQLDTSVNCWQNNRQVLDEVLMELPFGLIRRVMCEYADKIERRQQLFDTIAKTKHLSGGGGGKRFAYESLAMFVKEPLDYYTWILDKAVEGCGTDEDALIFIVLYRCEKDLVEIVNHFGVRYGGANLRDKIDGDVSGGFQNLLLSFLPPANEEEARRRHDLTKKRIESQKARLTPPAAPPQP